MGGELQQAVVLSPWSSEACSFIVLLSAVPLVTLLTGFQASFPSIQTTKSSCFDFGTGSLGGVHLFDLLEPHSLS